MESIKPSRVVLFLLIVFIPLGIISLTFPKNGIQITEDFNLKFISLDQLFGPDTVKYADVDELLATEQDSTLLKELTSLEDSLKAFKQFSLENRNRLQYKNDNREVLFKFFESLESVEDSNDFMHILHYGDSQIEIDRITGYVREQLQQKFGGSGPGLQPFYQIISAAHVSQSSSGNYTRYAAWSGGDTNALRASHGRYGIMYNFCEVSGGTVSFRRSSQAYEKAKIVDKVRLLVGDLESDLTATVTVDGNEIGSKTASKDAFYTMLEWDIPGNDGRISVNVSGGGNAEIYGISLDGKTGISMDNMPMRGCSGTIFTRGNRDLLKAQLESLQVKLIIFQFGGNRVVAIRSKEAAQAYGEEFYEQLMYIKRIRPDISIITIGLADMSTRINGKIQSWPHIEDVRDAFKDATFRAGGAYWDMYEAMGGHNSMPGWVNQNPPLAGKDYIHFTTRGAQKVAEWFYQALLNDYQVYRLEKRIKKLNTPQ